MSSTNQCGRIGAEIGPSETLKIADTAGSAHTLPTSPLLRRRLPKKRADTKRLKKGLFLSAP